MTLVQTFPKPVRYLDPTHLAMVRREPCCFCSTGPPSEASHQSWIDGTGISTKANDLHVIPTCHGCHDKGVQDKEYTMLVIIRLLTRRLMEAKNNGKKTEL